MRNNVIDAEGAYVLSLLVRHLERHLIECRKAGFPRVPAQGGTEWTRAVYRREYRRLIQEWRDAARAELYGSAATVRQSGVDQRAARKYRRTIRKWIQHFRGDLSDTFGADWLSKC